MKLSLSARIAESFHSKTEASLSIDVLIDLARSLGYDALCMRASQAGVHSTPEHVDEVVSKIAASGIGTSGIGTSELAVSMVTADFAVPRNDETGPGSLRAITPSLDLAERFGADFIRVCMKEEGDIAHAQRAADEARERGIRLAHQSHFGSLFETVDGAIDVLNRIDRENFGLIYEPANWMLCGQDEVAAIRRVAPWIFNVYVQNHIVRDAPATDSVETWTRGRVELDHIGIWDEGGVDAEGVFRELRAIGYDGYVTAHQAFEGVMDAAEAARRTMEFLTPRTRGA